MHGVLYNQAPEELYDDDSGLPRNENAEHTIFALQKDEAAKFFKNKRKHQRRVERLKAQGAFRAPESLNWKDRKILQATHEGRARRISQIVGTKVYDEQDNAFEIATVEAAPRDAVTVRLPPRLQRPRRQTKSDKRDILEPWAQHAIRFLTPLPNQETDLADFGNRLRVNFPVRGLGEVGFDVAMNFANIRGSDGQGAKKFAKLFDHIFGLSDRERRVYLRPEAEDASDSDQPPPRPSIRERDEYLAAAYDEVRGFAEFDEV